VVVSNLDGLIKATVVAGSEAFGEHSETDINFGQFDFVALPRKGEFISLHYDHSFFQLMVLDVVYEGARHPRPTTGLSVVDDRDPSVCLIVRIKSQIR
jgi:hypothetical protein